MGTEKWWEKSANIALDVILNERGYDQLMAEFLSKARKVCLNCGKKLWRFEKIVEIEFEIPRTSSSDVKDLDSKDFRKKTYNKFFGICTKCGSKYLLVPGYPPKPIDRIPDDKMFCDDITEAHLKDKVKNAKCKVLNIQTITIDKGY
jgi:DNA-directed RNA polymerase subunit RPC12/RpoP